jgi:isoleucyl-tRNA synthetase
MAELQVGSKGTGKRDALRANEIAVQEQWDQCRAFESDATEGGAEKFIVTFPYPYSNGHLHIGHAFSLTKAVFRAQYERHLGKNVLFPFAFHCTGMPIQAVSRVIVPSQRVACSLSSLYVCRNSLLLPHSTQCQPNAVGCQQTQD